MSLLDKKLEPAEIFKFTTPGDRIHAKFLGRRTVSTKSQAAAAVLDCDIIESRVDEESGPTGAHRIFESMHIKQFFDEMAFEPGENFILQFCSVTAKGFKKFALEKVEAPDGEAPPPDDSDKEWFEGPEVGNEN